MNLRRLDPVGSVSLLLLALLLAAGGSLSAQDRSPRADDSFDAGPVVEPHIEASPPEELPSVEAPQEPSSGTDSSVGPDTPDSTSPGDPPGRYAVPVTEPAEPHRQRPHRGQHTEPNPPGGDDEYVPDEAPDASYTYEDEATYPSPRGPVRPVLGALDLDLSPGRTQIYLDGSYLGIADQYDGWPSYLLLEGGTYDLVFYLDGYRTMARQVTVLPGTVIKMNDRLERGPSILPEEIFSRQEWGSTSGSR